MTVFQDNIRVSLDIFNQLKCNHSGEVLLTTSKGVYLQLSSHILLITSDKFDRIPLGIGISRYVDFTTALSPRAGDPVRLENGCIHFPNGILQGSWTIYSPERISVKPQAQQIIECAKQLIIRCNERSLAILAAPLILGQPLPAEEDTNPQRKRAYPLLKLLIDGLAENDPTRIDEAVGSLLGLGIGLTPSSDDVLLGLLYGLQTLAPQEGYVAVLSEVIQNRAQTHTNAISAAYLNAVAQGAQFQRLDDMLACLGSDSPINIDPILEIGSSSGSEMLLGLLMASNITLKG